MRSSKEIVIRSVDKPVREKDNVDALIKWFCEAFGLSKEDEKDSIEEEILKKFIYAALKDKGISSGELKFGKPIPRSTIIYHLNRFIDAGLIIKRGRRYYLRSVDMAGVIKELEYDMDREIRRMLDMAEDLNRIILKSSKRRSISD
ncbi:MAG: winged helix-turn-helix domain-containing protein [Candidatus Micrarchaeia archaeon]